MPRKLAYRALRLMTSRSYAESLTADLPAGALPLSTFGIVRDSAWLRLCRMRHRRRSYAKLCRAAGGGLKQIQLLLGHASVQTTERYFGTKQDLVNAPNDGIKLKERCSTARGAFQRGPVPFNTPISHAVQEGDSALPDKIANWA
jgi:integrase